MRSECGARARSRKPCELPSKQTLSYKTPLDCSTKNQWLSCVLQNAAAVISTAAPVIGIPQNEGRQRRAFTPATGPTSLTWQARAQVQPHKTREKNPSSARKLRARSWKLPAAALSKQQRYSTITPARTPGFLAVTDGTIAVGTVMERDHSFFSYGTDEVLIGEYPTLAAAVRSLPRTDGALVRRNRRQGGKQ
jgi:hypothetical protein